MFIIYTWDFCLPWLLYTVFRLAGNIFSIASREHKVTLCLKPIHFSAQSLTLHSIRLNCRHPYTANLLPTTTYTTKAHIRSHHLPNPLNLNKSQNKSTKQPTRLPNLDTKKTSIMPRKAASASTSTSAPTSWEKVDFLNDLLVAFYQVGCHTNSFNPQVNNAIVEFLTSRGYDTSWSAIR